MSILYGDDPIVGDYVDSLGRKKIVDRIVSSLNILRQRTPSAVAALVGPWGSGKTTLLNQVEAALARDTQWRVAKYNPWSYATMETAVPAFFSEIRAALPEGSGAESARVAIGGWISRLAPLGSIASAAGADLTGPMQLFADLVSGDRSPEKLRTQAAGLLQDLDTPVLVLIDDLDRLGPDELLMTFKLVRLLGRLPNVYYLLSYDERTLQDVLMRTGLVADEKSRAREYMEKMIQLRLDIPSMLPDDRMALVNTVLQEVLSSHGLQLNDQDEERLSRSWRKCLDRYIIQPRAAKRLFTQVDATWNDVAGEVDFVDFVLMTFLRTFEPSVYGLVEEHSDELLSTAGGVLRRDRAETHQQCWERWLGYIEAADARYPTVIVELLADLFVPLRSARDNMQYGAAARTDISNRKGVGHPDYFYRYTQTGVPQSDISESVILECLRELRESRPSAATEAVTAKLVDNAPLVIAKIMRHGADSTLPVEGLMQVLGANYKAIAAKETGVLARPSWPVLGLAEQLMLSAPEHALTVVKTIYETESGLALVCDLMRQILRSEPLHENKPDWFEDAKSIVADRIEDHLMSLHATTSDTEFEEALRSVWALRDLTSDQHAKDFLWGRIESGGIWNIAKILAAMTPIGRGSDGQEEWISVGELEAESIDSLLGIERVAEELGDILNSNASPSTRPRFSSHPTLGERTQIVLESFARILQSFRTQQE
ncbi:P-loop NTPase fold protein [Arthrobacter sp. C9C5]|uniref:KAP family P-loop NTPase fold protein n=1 Tax=Arthrobacter sp. C9C5 TaxID=2735267 RepID=UPI001585CEAB|nr:AAA family ATPase [Arthrobacter sp. C9C5]